MAGSQQPLTEQSVSGDHLRSDRPPSTSRRTSHRNGNGNGEATPKQRAFIERLCAAKGADVAAWPTHSKQEASESIKRLMALPEQPAAAAAA